MSDVNIRIVGCAGRITLTRPKALNAISYDMCMAIEAALDAWATDDAVRLVVIDAEGERAFCAGGDIVELYEIGKRGDFTFGQKFWADEYRMNNKIYTFPKPIVSFMQGYTFGGGVGIGCHGSHRIVGETTQIAMPECSIGLVPDVGGSYILAKAPGRLGEYLGTTGARMDADDAIYAGFADTYITHEKWPAVIASLEQDGDLAAIDAALTIPVTGPLRGQNKEIDRLFDVVTLDELLTHLRADRSRFAADTLEKIAGSSPLSMACCIDIIARLRGGGPSLQQALGLEYRFTYRASEHGDLLEGIRAAMIDKDHTPEWQFADMNVPESKVAEMLLPLGDNTLKLEENP